MARVIRTLRSNAIILNGRHGNIGFLNISGFINLNLYSEGFEYVWNAVLRGFDTQKRIVLNFWRLGFKRGIFSSFLIIGLEKKWSI